MKLYNKLLSDEDVVLKSKVIAQDINFADIVTRILEFYQSSFEDIVESRKGLRKENEPRKIAMYLCQQLTGSPQKEIAEFFNLQSIGSVSYTTHMVRVKMRASKEFAKTIKSLINKVIRQVV